MTHSAIITATELAKVLQQTTIKVFDTSWHMPDISKPNGGRCARTEYETMHIPGAQFMDIDEVVAPNSPLPHAMPDAATFQHHMRCLGLNQNDHVIVYDNSAFKTAARAWWMLRAMGHIKVSVLDGGLNAWINHGLPTEAHIPEPSTGDFIARPRPDLIMHMDDMIKNLETGKRKVIDARAEPRFAGTVPEPRPGLAAGHIPGAINVPFSTLYREDGTLKSPSEIEEIFANTGVNPKDMITTSCGSGVTACNLAHALYTLGNDTVAVYDGSWSEWGANGDVPIATGT